MKDVMAEMLVGEEGAIRCIGKFYIMPSSGEIEEMPKILVAGVVVSPEGGKLVSKENEGYAEMWEAEIIIIPKRKYSGTLTEKRGNRFKDETYHPYSGYRIDQVLVSDFGNPEVWGPEYFERQKNAESNKN